MVSILLYHRTIVLPKRRSFPNSRALTDWLIRSLAEMLPNSCFSTVLLATFWNKGAFDINAKYQMQNYIYDSKWELPKHLKKVFSFYKSSTLLWRSSLSGMKMWLCKVTMAVVDHSNCNYSLSRSELALLTSTLLLFVSFSCKSYHGEGQFRRISFSCKSLEKLNWCRRWTAVDAVTGLKILICNSRALTVIDLATESMKTML